eukprot:7181360-Alexandrium_andersonii.AAC.1
MMLANAVGAPPDGRAERLSGSPGVLLCVFVVSAVLPPVGVVGLWTGGPPARARPLMLLQELPPRGGDCGERRRALLGTRR